MHALLLAAALALAPSPDETPLPSPPPAVAPAEVMAVPEELRRRFHEEVLASASTPQQRLEGIVAFMLDADALGIAYAEDATYSVGQTYAVRRANCLSFTLLFLALAREAGLDARPQEIANTLAWHQDRNTIYRNHHVNTRVSIGGRIYLVDSGGSAIVMGERPAIIPQKRLLAHYYNNLAMQHLARGDATTGLEVMQAALATDPGYAALWSNTGVLHMRNGDPSAAEHAYAKALSLDAGDAGVLFNLVGLSRRQGDARREADFRRRLARVQQRDPLHHFLLGLDQERNGDHAQAIRHYRSAVRLYGGEHRFHSALARAYLKAGDPRRAGRALKRAQALSQGDASAAYRAQLELLQPATR